MSDPRPVLTPEHGELCAALLAGWAKREGLLGQVTEEQFTVLARAFTVGFAYGVGTERGDRDGAEAVRVLRGLER